MTTTTVTQEDNIETHERLTRIETNISNINITLEVMNHRLFGNGQPGVIQRFQAEIKEEQEFTFRVKGVLTVLGFVGLAEILHVFGKI